MRSFHPSNPSAGNNVSATLIRQLIAEVKASRIIAGPGVSVRRTPQGTHVTAKPGFSQGKGGVSFWTLSTVTDKSGKKSAKWSGKILQVGMQFFDYDSSALESYFSDDTEGKDGMYSVEVDLNSMGSSHSPPSIRMVRNVQFPYDLQNGNAKVYFRLGQVEGEKLLSPVRAVPVIYVNL